MNTINFNDLPSEIKSKIYNINKEEEQKEYYKKKYKICMDELKMIIEELPFYFDLSEYVDEEMDDIGDDTICSFILVYQLELRYGCIRNQYH